MGDLSIPFSNKKTSKIVFGLSWLVVFFWLFGNVFDVYQFVVVGIVFEVLWLPVMLLSVVLPIVALVLFAKDKFHLKSLNLYSFLLVLVTIMVMVIFL